MALLIDGFNLIYKFPDLEGMMYEGRLNDARKGLLNKLKEYQKIKKINIRVVFDGKRNPSDTTRQETSGTIDVYYSHEYSADHLIKEFIKKDPNPRMETVVTSDKGIIFYLNRFRPKMYTSEKFADHVMKTIEEYYADKTPEKDDNPQLSEDDIEYWDKVFKGKK